MNEVLFVSKAIAPPWNDSGKNLVRDLAAGLARYRPIVMTGPDAGALPARARAARVYAGATGFAPALRDQARVFAHLLTARRPLLWHFFFAPNPRSCLAGRAATRLRRVPAVHTVSSAPRDPARIVPLLFAEQHVVLSAHTERRLVDAGLARTRITRIAPGIVPLARPSEATIDEACRELGLSRTAPIVVYPGDLEFGEGASLMIEAARALRQEVQLVLACRAKTPHAQARAQALIARCHALGLASRVRFAGETRRIRALLAAADVVALPSTDLYAKMDYPLVLLEAMSLARTVIVARESAAEELADSDAAVALEAAVEPLAHGIARLLDDASARARIGACARRAVDTRYTHVVMAEAYERVYDALLG